MVIRFVSSIHKWDHSKEIQRDDAFINGDTIAELRTSKNRLSVWKGDSDEDIHDAIVALALSRDHLNKVLYMKLDEQELSQIGIEMKADEPGVAQGLEHSILLKHRDLVDIDYWHIGFLAEYMLNLSNDLTNIKTITRSEVKGLLNEYRDANKIEADEINSSLKIDLTW